jgi:hypothetical protein
VASRSQRVTRVAEKERGRSGDRRAEGREFG